ncbi:MAG: acylphosphatase [Micropruina sp.]|uniref:acylphosphatase n=1 Tax=Micropruina sp. TaxID=2737536 RepID=UPI0039E2C295
MERAVIRVDGYVQGVGFRWWTMGLARQLQLVGYARNLVDGRVEVDAQGSTEALGVLIRALIEQPTRHGRPGRVTEHTVDWVTPDPTLRGFSAY